MNNQELINYTQEERRTHQKSNSFQLGYRTAMKRVYDKAVRLDELRKPVVPQFVADWYEDNKDDFEFDLYTLCLDYHNCEVDEKLSEWFCDNHNKPLETLVNMHQFGYRVYKEKLYTAKLKSTGEYLRYNKKTGALHHFKPSGNEANQLEPYHFTEDTLIKYNAWGNNAYDINEVRVKNDN